MSKFAALVYGLTSYVLFLGVFVLLALFLIDAPWLPVTVDRGPHGAIGPALAVDAALIALFGLQHTLMARPGFKAAWTRLVPAPIERSTYVLASVGAVLALVLFWRPIAGDVWAFEGAAAWAMIGLFALGTGIVLVSTFLIDHFELFGLKQVIAYARGVEHRPPAFRLTPFHRVVRHPLYVGWILMFVATPRMTAGHVALLAGIVAYILIAIPFEERDLHAIHGPTYAAYRTRVPALVPRLRRSPRDRVTDTLPGA